MELTRPTHRWNHETRRAEPLTEEGAPPPSPAYDGSQDTVKGRLYEVLVPHGLRERAEAAGLDLPVVIRAAALRGIRDATKLALEGAEPDRTGNGKQAALARAQLGAMIQKYRQQRQMSRRDLMARVCNELDRRGIDRVRGWGPGQAQQWEIGRSAPKLVDPVIVALRMDGTKEGDEMARLWAIAKRGVGEVGEIPLPPAFPNLPEPVVEEQAKVGELIGEAAGGLRQLLDEAGQS